MAVIEGIEQIIDKHAFFQSMSESSRRLIAGCASNAVFRTGQLIFQEGEPAEHFYLLRHGSVALELYLPGHQPLVVDTLGDGEILGWSWLVPPYRLRNDARAIGLVRAIRIDALCLRNKCAVDHGLGYEFYHRFLPVIADRLAAAQLQMLDIYGHPEAYNAADEAQVKKNRNSKSRKNKE